MISMRQARHSHGFTLIDLIVVVVLMAILLGVAAPNVRQFLTEQKVKSAAVDLVSALNYTRSEALKRNDAVRLEPDEEWNEVWQIVFGGESLRTWEVPGGLTITGPDEIDYLGNGRLSTAVEFQICNSDSSVRIARRIVRVDPSGRPNLSRGDVCGS